MNKKYLYLILPAVGAVFSYVIFAYACASFNISDWSDDARYGSAILMATGLIFGGLMAEYKNDQKS